MKSVAHLAALFFTLGAGVAGATDFLTYDATVDDSDPSEVLFETGTRLVAPGSFEHLVVVNWGASPTGGKVSGSIANVSTTGRSINFTSLRLYDNTSDSWTSLPLGADLLFSNVAVTGTVFTMELGGNASGIRGGQYSLTGNVVPVPEPETYAMMLAGVVAVGFMAARRRRRN